MRWNFIICLLLVSAVLAKPRPKRSLGAIKSLFVDKLFGSNKVVIAQPVLTNNETYQLFKIPGFNDIVIKLRRKDKPKDEAKPKPEDAVIVKPEVAIIGSYLGTTTQKETLLAIEMVKSLINSGILSGRRDSSIQELVVPFVPQPPRLKYYEDQNVPLNVYEGDQMLVPMGMQGVITPIQPPRLKYFEDQQVPLNVYEEGNVLIPMGVKEVVTPIQAQYSYKQKGPDADMTYKSYDGKDVIVTRTEKEPPLPQYIKMRIAEVASIGVNPYAVRQPLSMNGAPIPYYVNPGPMPAYTQEPIPLSHRIPIRNGAAEYVGSNIYGNPIIVDRNPIFPEPMPVASPYYVANNMLFNRCKDRSTVKICPQENIQIHGTNRQNIVSTFNKSKQQNSGMSFDKPKQETAVVKDYANEGESKANAYKIAVGEFLKNHSVNGQIVSRYVYKQMNGHSHENYTEVKIKEPPQLKGIEVEGSNKNLRKDYVLIPPKGVESSMLSVLSHNNKPSNGKGAEQDNKNGFISKISSNEVNRKQYVPSLKSNPIVVFEQLNTENRNKFSIQENFKANEAILIDKDCLNGNSKRGDIPEATF